MLRTDRGALRAFLAFVFRSRAEPRLRAGWRLLLQAALQVLMTLAAIILIQTIWPGPRIDFSDSGSLPSLAVSELIQLVAVSLSVFLARRLLDRRPFVSLGLTLDRGAAAEIGAGIAIAGMAIGAIFLCEWMAGWLTIQGFAWSAEPLPGVLINLLLFFALFVVVGWNEELMSRGYHLQTIASGMTLAWGLILSAAIFGVLHLGNPNASWVSVIGIFCAGLFLGYAYIRTGRLWLSIGLHIGWNFFEGVVFGFPVSGLATFHLARISVLGPVLWTGGAFGPEAGLIVLPGLALGMLLIHTYARTPSINETPD